MAREEGCSKSLVTDRSWSVWWKDLACVLFELGRIELSLNWALAPPFIDQGVAQGYKAYVVYDVMALMPIKSPGLWMHAPAGVESRPLPTLA